MDVVSKLLTENDIFPWIERELGGKVTASQRQGGRDAGGRPAWFIDFLKDGKVVPFYIRGDRGGDFGYINEYGLQREARILRVLSDAGIPVPTVVAACEEPSFLVLEFIEGQSDFSEIADAGERDSIARDFARIMAQWHAVPAEKFTAIGIHAPTDPYDLIDRDLQAWESGYYSLIREPVPLVTFACRWLRRNQPPMPERLVLLQGDTGPGQFLFKDGSVRTIVDWETAILGDPMRDLAHIRAREAWFPTGNLTKWFDYYSEFSGVPLDLERLRYYTVLSMLIPTLALGPVAQRLNPRDDHCLWLAQDVWSRRVTAEALAEVVGVELSPITLPEYEAQRLPQLFDVLRDNLAEEQLPHIADPFLQHRMRMTLQLLAHVRNVAEFGREIEALELDDMKTILGWRPHNTGEGHRAVDELVRRAGPDDDAALIAYFHRHAQREEALLRGAMGRAEHAEVTPIG
jgi:hypothetical protein